MKTGMEDFEVRCNALPHLSIREISELQDAGEDVNIQGLEFILYRTVGGNKVEGEDYYENYDEESVLKLEQGKPPEIMQLKEGVEATALFVLTKDQAVRMVRNVTAVLHMRKDEIFSDEEN